ncbi:hypothetical protein SAMN05216499_10832 [Actinacidiphila paucisporea]|uniref:Uncharacterized protein n=1 Tax=Actinacidiphila paucisporea TaxID=310782 RepID=A0A1M7FRB6_9ACTN|nr:hypothetical protein SAMN05216499_10832 [Actinacidiphila paucisporea]
MQNLVDVAYKGSPSGGPVFAFMTVLVIVFSLAVIVRLLRNKH